MLQVFIIIGFISAALWIGRNILFWVSLWQIKEYRLDRLRAHLCETRQGRKLLYSPMSFVKWLLILAYGIVVFNDELNRPYMLAITTLYTLEGCIVVWELLTKRLKRPAKTIKALSIIFLSSAMILLLSFLKLTDILLWMLLVDRMTIVVISLFVFFFAFPTEVYMDMKIQKARDKIQANKKLLVIAVSGSYGKSSTKECIAQILSTKHSVVKTEGSNNTPIGIAMTILNHIQQDTEIFVVEMGAYKKGEIAELCGIVQPDISVTTSVSDQHLSLFGTLENAMETEMELIHALPKTGLVLFNGNNENSTKLYYQTKKKKILYKSEPRKKDKHIDFSATDIAVDKNGVTFTAVIKGKQQHFTTPLLGSHTIQNILPAIYIASHLHMPVPAIKKAVASLLPPPKTMTKKVLTNGVTLVDDTFNASPESVSAAISYMKTYDKKKILVLMPLIELGENAKQRHYMLGMEMSGAVDYVFLTNNNFYSDIMKGIIEGNGKCVVRTAKANQIAESIIDLAASGDVVLFEGKEAAKVLAKLS